IVCDDQPFLTLESENLQNLFQILNSNIKIPSADTIHTDIIKCFNQEYVKIQDILQ
ncbi:12237_t:CDS:1, partial [Funneliformis caledonium]